MCAQALSILTVTYLLYLRVFLFEWLMITLMIPSCLTLDREETKAGMALTLSNH